MFAVNSPRPGGETGTTQLLRSLVLFEVPHRLHDVVVDLDRQLGPADRRIGNPA
jgi:hypothetical protein